MLTSLLNVVLHRRNKGPLPAEPLFIQLYRVSDSVFAFLSSMGLLVAGADLFESFISFHGGTISEVHCNIFSPVVICPTRDVETVYDSKKLVCNRTFDNTCQ